MGGLLGKAGNPPEAGRLQGSDVARHGGGRSSRLPRAMGSLKSQREDGRGPPRSMSFDASGRLRASRAEQGNRDKQPRGGGALDSRKIEGQAAGAGLRANTQDSRPGCGCPSGLETRVTYR